MKYTYQKKSCQETWPGKPTQPYGEPLTFYEQQGNATGYDISDLYWRIDFRDIFLKYLNLPLREPLEDIGTVEDRIKRREEFVVWEAAMLEE